MCTHHIHCTHLHICITHVHIHYTHIVCVCTSHMCLHIRHTCTHRSHTNTHRFACNFKRLPRLHSQVESAFQTWKFLPALKISKAMRTNCRVSISFPPPCPGSSRKTLPDSQGQAQRHGSGKILARGGQAQGKSDRTDSVSSSRQPAAVTRVPREAGGVWRG